MSHLEETRAASPEFMSKRQVATLLGVSSLWLWRHVKGGHFPAPLRLGGPAGKTLRWRRAEVEEFLANAPRQDNRHGGDADAVLRPRPKAKHPLRD